MPDTPVFNHTTFIPSRHQCAPRCSQVLAAPQPSAHHGGSRRFCFSVVTIQWYLPICITPSSKTGITGLHPLETPLILILRCLIALSMESRVLFLAWAFFRLLCLLCYSCLVLVSSRRIPVALWLLLSSYGLINDYIPPFYGRIMTQSFTLSLQ